MNNEKTLLTKNNNDKSGLSERVAINSDLDQYLVHNMILEQSSYTNGSMGMIRRDNIGTMQSLQSVQVQEKEIKTENSDDYQEFVPEKKILTPEETNHTQMQTQIQTEDLQNTNHKTKENLAKLVGQKQAAAASAMNSGAKTGLTNVSVQEQKNMDQKPVQPAAQTNAAKQPAPSTQPVKTFLIHKINDISIDHLCSEYIALFKNHFGLELSASICYENMRKLIEPDVKDPLKTLYFLENTYRVSTLLYLTGNLPIVFVTSILAEKNRKNILKYVMIEVENGAKPYEDLKALRLKRWQAKQTNLNLNDAMTVTPGVTMLSNELYTAMKTQFHSVCNALKKFNREMTGIVKKFDDTVLHDITYIYSNWWYFLQGFENVYEMRTYVMAITDDTRKNLKI